ncbi:DUF2589 domain-containing protein [Methanoculleus sp.]|uniref:DUF2589 domain-containing protein n=1 Tax=Methanoculleus sp. TaxID=90427 RepID=UPI001BD3795E|nr:DUF2589 domain-containing protein [Methanoculleus sp.]
MEVLRRLIAAGLLVAVAGSAVCPIAGATAVPATSSLSDMASQFNGLPMEDLIGGPLSAVVRAQQRMAASQFDFLTGIGLEEFSGGTLQELV